MLDFPVLVFALDESFKYLCRSSIEGGFPLCVVWIGGPAQFFIGWEYSLVLDFFSARRVLYFGAHPDVVYSVRGSEKSSNRRNANSIKGM